jgi:hypothetical protein
MHVPQSELAKALEEPYLRVLFVVTSTALGLLWLLLLVDHVRTRMAIATFRGTSRATAALAAPAFPMLVVAFVVVALLAREGFIHEAYLLVAVLALVVLLATNGWLRSRRRAAEAGAAEARKATRFSDYLGEALPRWWEGFLGPWAAGLLEAGLERLPRHIAGRSSVIWAAIAAGFLVGAGGPAAAPIIAVQLGGGEPRSAATPVSLLLPIVALLAVVQAVALLARATWSVVAVHLWLGSIALVGWVGFPLWLSDGASGLAAMVTLPAVLTLILARCAYSVRKAVIESRPETS